MRSRHACEEPTISPGVDPRDLNRVALIVGVGKTRRVTMEPLAVFGLLAVIVGIVGLVVLMKGRTKNVR